MDETCLLGVLRRLAGTVNEVYLHPGASEEERRASASARVREALFQPGVSATTFRELAGR
jgi:hypothetical protein